MFMTVVMRLDNAAAANQVSTWTGTTYILSIVGALISDSYWGRYKASTIFQLIFLAGLVELSISTHFFLRKYCDFGDGASSGISCKPPRKQESLMFYISIYQIALGNGAYQPAVTTFGADQFDEEDVKEGKSKKAFFSYFFVANNLGSLASATVLSYIEDKGKWVMAFSISTGAAFLGVLLFAIGTLRYRHFVPKGNPLLSVCQVIVASVKNRRVKTPQRVEDLYEVDGNHSSDGDRKILHTPEYRFLDKAAVVRDPSSLSQDEHHPSKPWSLCTVTQVEEVKCIIRLIPIWLCSIIYSITFTQMSSVFIEQAATMDTSISKFNIPPAAMNIFEIFSVTAFVFIYSTCIAKPLSRISKEPTEFQRMGAGLALSAIAMITSGLVEQQRLKHANRDCSSCDASSSLTILWQIPQYVLIGASEVFMYVTLLEFFNDQIPYGLRSFGSALFVASMAVGSYVSSLLVTIVMTITRKGNQVGWISEDLNKGHMDRWFFLIAVLNAIDLLVFVVCAKRYRYVSFDQKAKTATDGDQPS